MRTPRSGRRRCCGPSPRREGVAELAAALDRHFAYLEGSGTLRTRRRARLRERVVEVTEDRIRRRLWRDAGTTEWVDAQLDALEAGSITPFAVADALLARSGDLLTRTHA
jgi:LAO/AO transport system kinase